MKKVAVEGDLTGGINSIPIQHFVTIEGKPIHILGDPVLPHGTGSHTAATLTTPQNFVTIDSIPIILDADPASCSDIITATSFVVVEN